MDAISAYLDHPVGARETLQLSDTNLFVRVLENVRGRDVFVVQAVAPPVNDNFMELFFSIDALKQASAASVTAGDSVLRRRQGRREGRAPRVDPGASVR